METQEISSWYINLKFEEFNTSSNIQTILQILLEIVRKY